MRQDLDFHLRANDYFGTLATVLDLIGQDLARSGYSIHAETLAELRDELLDLQNSCRIELSQ
jgi:hypothetical protein